MNKVLFIKDWVNSCDLDQFVFLNEFAVERIKDGVVFKLGTYIYFRETKIKDNTTLGPIVAFDQNMIHLMISFFILTLSKKEINECNVLDITTVFNNKLK